MSWVWRRGKMLRFLILNKHISICLLSLHRWWAPLVHGLYLTCLLLHPQCQTGIWVILVVSKCSEHWINKYLVNDWRNKWIMNLKVRENPFLKLRPGRSLWCHGLMTGWLVLASVVAPVWSLAQKRPYAMGMTRKKERERGNKAETRRWEELPLSLSSPGYPLKSSRYHFLHFLSSAYDLPFGSIEFAPSVIIHLSCSLQLICLFVILLL